MFRQHVFGLGDKNMLKLNDSEHDLERVLLKDIKYIRCLKVEKVIQLFRNTL